MIKPTTINLEILKCEFCGSIYINNRMVQNKCKKPTPACNVKPGDIVIANLDVLSTYGSRIGGTQIRSRVLAVRTPAEHYGEETLTLEILQKREDHRNVGERLGFKAPHHTHDWLVHIEPLEQPEETFGEDDTRGYCKEQWVNYDALEPAD